LVLLLSPLTPHIAEELWQALGKKGWVVSEPWPGFDENALKRERVMLVVQVNGVLRGRVEVPSGISEGEARGLAVKDPKVERSIGDKSVVKTVFVPDRLINLVVQ